MAELTVDLTYGTALYQAAAEINKEKQILEEGSCRDFKGGAGI